MSLPTAMRVLVSNSTNMLKHAGVDPVPGKIYDKSHPRSGKEVLAKPFMTD